MALETQKIIDLNTCFYNNVADQFSKSRAKPWAGWSKILKYIDNDDVVSDIGCGDGRFLSFLESNGKSCEYYGYDASTKLINKAQNDHPNANFYVSNIILEEPFRKSDVLCSFGLMHHIPNKNSLNKGISNIAESVNLNGIVILTFWDFDTAAEKTFNHLSRELGLTLEDGDYLLDWGGAGQNLRFCHLYSQNEIEALISSFKLLNLKLIENFEADKSNKYLIFKKMV